MKRVITLLLALVLAFCVFGRMALAAGGFDKSVFENSTKFEKSGFDWSLIGGYEKQFMEARIKVRAFLGSTYVSKGWGPELRIEYYNNSFKDYDEVSAFRASLDGVIYSFENLSYNDDPDIHGGYLFGGTVYQKFMADLLDVKDVSFQFVHTDPAGETTTSTIDHVHTGDLSNLQEMAKYLIRSKAFSTDTDPEGNDEYYGASIS